VRSFDVEAFRWTSSARFLHFCGARVVDDDDGDVVMIGVVTDECFDQQMVSRAPGVKVMVCAMASALDLKPSSAHDPVRELSSITITPDDLR
jgi:hypothetical protein